MTDLVTRPEATQEAQPSAAPTADPAASGEGTHYEWAPAEEKPRSRRKVLWLGIGIPSGIIVVLAAIASIILIAPGVAIAGVPVGWQTPGGAAGAVEDRLANTEITIAGTDATVTGAELGAQIDAGALAETAHGEHPLWNVGAWNPEPISGEITLDPQRATETLMTAAPDLFVEPVNAQVSFDQGSAQYGVTPAEPGQGVDIAALEAQLTEAFAAGSSEITAEPVASTLPAEISTGQAEQTAGQLNGMIDAAGFYVGEELAMPVDAGTLASWIRLEPDGQGSFDISADQGAIQEAIAGLPDQINRPVQDGEVVVNSNGDVLQTITPGQDGWELPSTDGIASAYAEQLAGGESAFQLEVNTVAHEMATLHRTIEVDLSSQQTIAYENGAVVGSWAISSGAGAYPSSTGHFTVNGHYAVQDMGDPDLEFVDYYTPDVPWVTYYNGDEAFHGTYWHNNFGTPMSHGCINMTIDSAKFIYDFAPIGTEVWVHA